MTEALGTNTDKPAEQNSVTRGWNYPNQSQLVSAQKQWFSPSEIIIDADCETILLAPQSAIFQIDSLPKERSVELQPNSLMYLQSGMAHNISFQTGFETITILMDKVWFHDTMALFEFTNDAGSHAQITSHIDYGNIARSVARHLQAPQLPSAPFLDLAIKSLLIRHAFQYNRRKAPQSPKTQLAAQIEMLLAQIDSTLPEKIIVGDLATKFRMTAAQFSRVFRSLVGVSPQAYILEQRVRYARRLIDRRTMPLAEVAIASGFSSQAHLTVMFSRFLGVTPGHYEKNTNALQESSGKSE